MPVFLTVLFLNFAAGLNLYYATMNLASIPQQLYLAKERRAAAETMPAKAKAET
jgi:membrane protein insertase Oxa1/YidC/SpoIIIJ